MKIIQSHISGSLHPNQEHGFSSTCPLMVKGLTNFTQLLLVERNLHSKVSIKYFCHFSRQSNSGLISGQMESNSKILAHGFCAECRQLGHSKTYLQNSKYFGRTMCFSKFILPIFWVWPDFLKCLNNQRHVGYPFCMGAGTTWP